MQPLPCPVCKTHLKRRVSQGLEGFVCDQHGVWQPWATIRALKQLALKESDDTNALIEGFVWGKLL